MPIYEPESPSFGEDRKAPSVLWGRVVAFGVILLLVFLGGRATGGGGSTAEVDNLKARLASAQAQIDQMDRLARSQTTTTLPVDPGIGGGTATVPDTTATTRAAASGSATTTTRAGGTTTTGSSGGAQTYTVKPGDTLRSIAAKLYGKTSFDSCLAKAQTPPITDPTKVQVNSKLILPNPAPTAPCP